MPSPRLLFVISGYPPTRTGGMELSCQRLAESLARRGHQVTVLTLADSKSPNPDPRPPTPDPRLRLLPVLQPLALGPAWGFTYMRQVRTWMRRLADEWDVVVCFQLYLHSIAAAAEARRLGKRSVTRLANSGTGADIDRLRAHRFGERLLRGALECDAFFALSNWGAFELASAGVSNDRVWRWPAFVDTERFAPDEPTTPPTILYHGRFEPGKNVELLIEAYDRLMKATPPHSPLPTPRLRLIGSGSLETQVRARAAASPFASSILIEPWTPHPEHALRTASVWATASEFEGLSNAMLEAMACGLPIVACDASGVRDVLDPTNKIPVTPPPGYLLVPPQPGNVGGWIVPPREPDLLAATLSLFIGDLEHARWEGRNARTRILGEFTEDLAVARFINAIQSIADNSPSTPAQRGFDISLFPDSRLPTPDSRS